MPNTKKPRKHGPPSPHTTRARPSRAPESPAASSTQQLASRVFRQLLEDKATPEAVVDGLRAAGLDPEAVGELLRAVRGCIEYVERLPQDVEDFEADDLTDYLAEDLGIDPDLAVDVVDAFVSLGEEA